MKKVKLSVFTVMLALAMVLIGQVIGFQGTSAYAQDVPEERSRLSASLEDNFADNRVLVTLKNEVSRNFNSYSREDFSEISCVSVADLTKETAQRVRQQQFEATSNNFEATSSRIDIDNFTTTLRLDLAERSKGNVLKAIKELEKRDDVLYAEPDYIMTFFGAPNPPPTKYSSQWALNNSNTNNAFLQMHNTWNITKGKTPIKVAIMDSGIDATHSDLAGKVDTALSRDFTKSSPYTISSVTDSQSGIGHGTMVAGIVAAQGAGVIGIAPNVTLASLRVADPDINPSNGQYQLSGNSAAFISTTVLAFEYAVGKFDVVNLSAGYYGTLSSILKSKIEAFGKLVVCAVGNENRNNNSIPVYPASFNSPNIISVGASTNSDARASFSDYGSTTVSVFAPGANIISTAKGGGYSTQDGASLAAPHVAGVAALMLSIDSTISATILKTVIVNNGELINVSTPIGNQNVRRLNAFRAVSAAAFTTTSATGGISITGFRTGYAMPNNTNLTLPDSFVPLGTTQQTVTAIGNGAFQNQAALSQITIPASVIAFGSTAFHTNTRVDWQEHYSFRGSEFLGILGGQTTFEIPSTIAGRSIITIAANAFLNCTSLSTLIIPSSVTKIGEYAFNNCTNLTNITIPSGVTKIGDGAFNNCTNLTGITIPDSVASIGVNAFNYSGLWNNAANNGIIYTGKWVVGVKGIVGGSLSLRTDTVGIGDYALGGCDALTDITLPQGLKYIGESAFEDCFRLTNIVIPNSVTSIGFGAFVYCSGLTGITVPFAGNISNGTSNTHFGYIFGASGFIDQNSAIPSTLKTVNITGSSAISNNAFYKCAGLTEITISAGVTSINVNAFYNCTALANINVNPANTSYSSVDGVLFNKNKTSLLYYPLGKSGTSYVIPSGVTIIGDSAFTDHAGLTKIEIPATVKTIGNRAFMSCTGLTDLIIPNGVTSIGDHAFYACTGLKAITIPGSVTSIGNYAFYSCIGLTAVHIESSAVINIGNSAFYGCFALTGNIYVPAGSLEAYKAAASWADYQLFLKPYTTGLSYSYISSTDSYSASRGTSTAGVVYIPVLYNGKYVTNIADNAFYGYTALTKIIIPDNIKAIGSYAFYGCTGLTEAVVERPAGEGLSPTTLGAGAFGACSSIKRIIVPVSSSIDYKTATNWKVYAHLIIELSKLEESVSFEISIPTTNYTSNGFSLDVYGELSPKIKGTRFISTNVAVFKRSSAPEIWEYYSSGYGYTQINAAYTPLNGTIYLYALCDNYLGGDGDYEYYDRIKLSFSDGYIMSAVFEYYSNSYDYDYYSTHTKLAVSYTLSFRAVL